ncbi:hypothetical protein [Rummeliibacillus pycnus]|uniref:hypothetical protein n=1 Tax=Rummeliibacillus pycnus TaxID=101070 RepID=UPI003D2E9C53
MKRKALSRSLFLKLPFIIIFFLLFTSSVFALSWAYSFVSWHGYVYQVSDEKIPVEKIGNEIGEVDTIPDKMTGDYNGNASNIFDIGTKYYQIVGEKTEEVIAVKDGDKYLKAAVEYKQSFSFPFYIKEHSKMFKLLSFALAFILLFMFFRKLVQNKRN